MQQKRSLVVIIATLLALSIVVFVSGRLDAPESGNSSTQFKDGDTVSMRGEMVCLQHTDQEGPTTLECAYGFREAESGTYYGVEDASEDYSIISSVPMNQPVQIEGIYRTNPDTKYIQNGTIQATSITE